MVTETIARGAAVSISHLHHAFTLGKQTVPVLENISLQLRPGESVALLSPSGCGKSALLRLLAGLEAPQERTDADRRRGAPRPGAGANSGVSGSDALSVADGAAERAAGAAGAGQKEAGGEGRRVD